MSQFKLSLIQLLTSASKLNNLHRARDLVRQAVQQGAQVIVLPECFNSPYGTQHFKKYAEDMNGETCTMLSKLAKETSSYIIGGSFPERLQGKIYNTCTFWDRNGKIIGVHRKLHLFDIDLPGISFHESETLTAGNCLTHVETEYGSIGIGICILYLKQATICVSLKWQWYLMC